MRLNWKHQVTGDGRTYDRSLGISPAGRGKPMITALLQLASRGRTACKRPCRLEQRHRPRPRPKVLASTHTRARGHGRTDVLRHQTNLARLRFTTPLGALEGVNGALFDPGRSRRCRRFSTQMHASRGPVRPSVRSPLCRIVCMHGMVPWRHGHRRPELATNQPYHNAPH